ncbi:MAG TPA: MobF family relaxase [Mycobacteriales bacterium]|nr:MobF family relaxase [Mycobacteriales bacterium]
MISIGLLGSGPDAADYYLDRQAGCELDYYLGHGERTGVWLGRGAAALGLAGTLDDAGEGRLRGLLAGVGPDGDRLVPELRRSDPRTRLPARPLLTAIQQRAGAGQPIARALAAAGLEAAFEQLSRSGRRTRLDVGLVGRLASAAGIEAGKLYRTRTGTDRYARALAKAGGTVDARRAGLDVTISAPKSVSALYALGSPEVAASVRAAHEAAVGEALSYLEWTCEHGLRGHQGRGRRARRIVTDGLIAVGFTHRTSRAGEPQLHTHLVAPNLVRGVDRKWSALDSRAIHRHATTASYLYQAVLRGQLSARLGVGWTRPVKGIAEIAGVPRPLRELFSTRRAQIKAELARLGRDDPAAAQQACLSTRPAKPQPLGEPGLRERWSRQARDAGFDAKDLERTVLRQVEPPPNPPIAELAAPLLGARGLAEYRSNFDARDIFQALCQALPPGSTVTALALRRWTQQVLASSEIVRLHAPGPESRYSTTEMLDVEDLALALADRLRQRRAAGLPEPIVRRVLADVSGEQGNLITQLLVEPRGLHIVVGPAGAGKTAALSAAAQAWQAAGAHVIGAALAANAARNLQTATGIPSTSLARLLEDLDRIDPDTDRPAGLAPGSVLVVDEAGMVGTRTLARLFAHTDAANASLVLVGDPRQLPEIEAGGLFAALAARRDTTTLHGNQRQPERWEQAALADLRGGALPDAVRAYLAHHRVHPDSDAQRTRVHIVADYLIHRAAVSDPGGVVILTARRADARILNDLVRTWLIGARTLGGAPITVTVDGHPREFRTGDEVLVTRNDYRFGLLNGTRARVTAVSPHGLRLSVDADRHVDVSTEWLAAGRLDHSYAMTVHKAQGLTLDVALL